MFAWLVKKSHIFQADWGADVFGSTRGTICLDAGREAYTPPHTLKHIAEFEDHVLTGPATLIPKPRKEE